MQQPVPSRFRCAVASLAAAIALLSGCGGSDTDLANPGASWPPRSTVTAHRGASALRPEHTLASYRKAIEDGADIVEPDLVATKDGVLVARHENEISGTTNVATLPQFAARKAIKTIDGVPITGWFTEDFTLAELKTLRARERIPANRPANVAYNDQFEIPTLQEVIDLVREESRARSKVIGLYPETKHPSYFKSIGLPLEKRLVDVLAANGYRGKEAAVFIQSFETENLKELRSMTDIRLVQLIDSPSNAPYDFVAAGNGRTYASMITAAGLKEVAAYANVVSPYKEIIIPRTSANELAAPTGFVANAHAAGLLVHTWTLRPENPFLPTGLRAEPVASASQRGNAVAEIRAYLDAGIDGFFTDDPAVGRAAVDGWVKK
ncbi:MULTISPECIES: glycerophosphodiester phosphodiesterase [unclassified Massilia]|uniref:glycerophosphodiester phosphodiesterase n=1 Tax=unclassified Massilia TaxID=2609279 RepID=UPI001E2AA750|nr:MULTISPECIES: glycerophosphodiester phosphodiesterase [unclassified Massilia]